MLPKNFYYIDLESVVKGNLIKDTVMSKLSAPSRAQRLVETNDILFQTVRPYQQNNYIFETERDIPTVASTGYAQIRTNENAYFLYTLLHTKTFLDKVLVRCTGSSYPAINSNDLGEISLSIPTKEEQRHIADFIKLLDQRISTQNKLLAFLKSYKRGVKSKFFDDFNNGWKEVPLSAILTERKTYCEKDGTYTHATLSKEGVSAKTERYDRDYLVSSDDKKYKITHYGDICYNPANLKFGVICLNTFGDAIFSPIYVTFEVNAQYDTCFIGECVTRADFINKALQFQQGTVYERMAVSPEDLLSMTIKVPSLAEQVRVAKCLRSYDLLIEKYDAILTNLVSMKKSLLSQLFI